MHELVIEALECAAAALLVYAAFFLVGAFVLFVLPRSYDIPYEVEEQVETRRIEKQRKDMHDGR